MTNDSLNEKTLTERWKEHCAGPKDSLRAKLIDAVAEHDGWEEGAVSIVDTAVMPVIRHEASLTLPSSECKESTGSLHKQPDILNTLLPCPICGSAAQQNKMQFVKCGNTNCWLNGLGGVTPDLWNRRAEPARSEDMVSRDYMLARVAAVQVLLDAERDKASEMLVVDEQKLRAAIAAVIYDFDPKEPFLADGTLPTMNKVMETIRPYLRKPKREYVTHEWKNEPQVRTTPIKCLLCSDEAVAVVHAPDGCTCSPNK